MSFILKTRVAGSCPKLGGTADKYIRPCHVDGRGVFFVVKRGEEDDKSRVTRKNRD